MSVHIFTDEGIYDVPTRDDAPTSLTIDPLGSDALDILSDPETRQRGADGDT